MPAGSATPTPTTGSKIDVVSNPHVGTLKVMYTLILWLERENKKEKGPLQNNRSFNDLTEAKDDEIERIFTETGIPLKDIRTAMSTFQQDLQHVCKS